MCWRPILGLGSQMGLPVGDSLITRDSMAASKHGVVEATKLSSRQAAGRTSSCSSQLSDRLYTLANIPTTRLIKERMVGGFMHRVEEARKQQGRHQHSRETPRRRAFVWRLSLCWADPCMDDMDRPCRPRVANR